MIPFIKEKLQENWILKITAIFLALFLWLFIRADPDTVAVVDADVEIRNMPPNMEISNEIPSTVQVRMRGARQELVCIIDLQNAGEGEKTILLTEEQIKSSKGLGVRVSQVNPSQITLMLEKRVLKKVPITVPVQGDVADGFEIYDKATSPEVVEIEGPRSHVESVEEVSTDIIDLNDLDQSLKQQVSLNFKDGTIHPSVTDPIWVEITIGPRRREYFINKVPLEIEDESYVASPKQIDIRLMAPENLQPDLVPGNFSAKIKTRNLDESSLPAKVKPVISYREEWKDKIKEMGTRPSEVTVRKINSKSPER